MAPRTFAILACPFPVQEIEAASWLHSRESVSHLLESLDSGPEAVDNAQMKKFATNKSDSVGSHGLASRLKRGAIGNTRDDSEAKLQTPKTLRLNPET